MNMDAFVSQLHEHGSVLLSTDAPPDSYDVASCRDAVVEMDHLARLEMPGNPPAIDVEAASWALTTLYRLCQCLAYRDIPPEDIAATTTQPCPRSPSPAVAYSVDLAFRYLPDLMDLGRALASDDPFVAAIIGLCRQWPLSSVGTGDLGQLDISHFIDNDSLRQLYVDRIIEKSDGSRAQDPRVRNAIGASTGLYDDLCPGLARALKENNS